MLDSIHIVLAGDGIFSGRHPLRASEWRHKGGQENPSGHRYATGEKSTSFACPIFCGTIRPSRKTCIIIHMNTKQKLDQAFKEAMKARDDVAKRTLRMVRAAIKNAEIERRTALDDSAVLSILQKEVKSRQETITEARKAGRDDMIADTEAEIAILQQFLPQPLSAEELESLARAVIAEVGATSPAHMGQVMKALMPRLQGRADGKQASQVVRTLLQNPQ